VHTNLALDTGTRTSRILLVDDETAITDNLAPFLKRAGFSIGIADEGETALRLVHEFSPDLVVLDVLMPCLDGRQVLRRMRQDSNWAPVILLTQIAPRCAYTTTRCWKENAPLEFVGPGHKKACWVDIRQERPQ